jgi:prophage antirepressor-like protein
MSDVIPFDFNGSSIRVLELDGEPWFVAKDVADVLEYSDAHKMVKKLDDDEVQNRQVGGSGFNNKGTLLINEAGLYSVTLTSQKPQAKSFKRWVTHDVLPSIRKGGSYSLDQQSQGLIPELQAVEVMGRMLRISDTGKIRMMERACRDKGISTAFLPDYTDESLTRALGDLLKEHGSGLSARAANTILMDMGLLEELERRASGNKKKAFKSITEEGLKYGKNETSPQNPNQTQPRYYVSLFPELLDRIQAWLSQDSMAS